MGRDVRMKGFTERSSLQDVETLIDTRINALPSERIPFSSSLHRTLASDVHSDRNIPPHDKSAMDGFALRSADLPGTLKIIGQIMAAERYEGPVGPGQAVRIMTGARLPEGADTVVMVEQTRPEGDSVEVPITQSTGKHVLKAGEDLTEGQRVLEVGRRLRPQDISMLVSVGALEVEVYRKPRVRIIPTGTELVPVGTDTTQPQASSRIVESNSYMLQALAERDGAEVELHPIVRDDTEALRRALVRPGADLVVVTGGSSVGLEDFGPVIVREVGELPIHGVHMRPASPCGLGFVGDHVVLLAPGFPVSSYVAWDMIGRRVVQRMVGIEPHLPYPTVRARWSHDRSKRENRVELFRVAVSGDGDQVEATEIKGGSALLSTTTRADGFALLPTGVDGARRGDPVDVYLYSLPR